MLQNIICDVKQIFNSIPSFVSRAVGGDCSTTAMLLSGGDRLALSALICSSERIDSLEGVGTGRGSVVAGLSSTGSGSSAGISEISRGVLLSFTSSSAISDDKGADSSRAVTGGGVGIL